LLIQHLPTFRTNSFLNVIISTSINLAQIRYGRKRSFQDAPRTLDIDIIFFDNKKINTQNLIIPHKNWASRESVIIPLKRIK
jgi:2-amino-4-hydroxy-6-hydroxymethyldihydropteridine diphosphokinase